MQNTVVANDDAARHNRRLLRSLLIDFLIFIVLLLPVIVCEFMIEPFRRGFFCSDETLKYPYLPNTITEVALGVILGTIPLVLFVAVEFVRFYHRGDFSQMPLLMSHWRAPTWLLQVSKQFAYFFIGLLLTFDATEVGKYTIGRLRPHFMAVCQPQLLDGSTCDSDPRLKGRYIEDYICAASGFTASNVRQARLSFPSGHSSLIFYAMVYLTLYLQRRMKWRGSILARHFLQFALLMLAWFTALSRVMDNWHHWSDVLVGSVLGVIGALLNAVYIAKLFKPATFDEGRNEMKLQLPLQQEVSLCREVPATPPPYSLNSLPPLESLHTLESLHSGYSNEQYCTKV